MRRTSSIPSAARLGERKPVREFFFHNMLYWLEEFRFDGLRFDAIDHIRDASDEPLLIKMAREVRARFPDRHIHLTIEDEDNSTRLLKYGHDNRPRLFTAAWNDDWHHAMHALLTGEPAVCFASPGPKLPSAEIFVVLLSHCCTTFATFLSLSNSLAANASADV